MIPNLLLEELGVPFERVRPDRADAAHKAPAYLRLSANKVLPTLTAGDLARYKTVAICLHLCDAHPKMKLAPAMGSIERGHFYKRLVWLNNSLQDTLLVYFHPERWHNDDTTDAEVKALARDKVGELLDQLDTELARHGGPWFMGRNFSALDPYVFTLCRWTRGLSSRPARARPHLGPYLQRMAARPATQQAMRKEYLIPPRT
ncbi:glutathione binding-like protein [Rhodoferax sp.]|uniref:glutathione S-transferase family protein n=1 Tax=Rhodoferax sp. TaxID=50421 RepID=UPI00260809E7|nr:glutathione binding-like protein [Rhodoferax sp.]MDD2924939.1 glutathione binding-like protein [Rhodoferax sp.]